MNKVSIDGKKYLVPESWNELNEKSYLFILNTLFTVKDKTTVRGIIVHYFFNFWFEKALLNGKEVTVHEAKQDPDNAKFQCKRGNKSFIMPFITGMQLITLVGFAFNEKKKVLKNHLSIIRIGLTKFYGPADDFENLLLLEFSFADTYYMQYLKTGKQEFLDKMIATLYRNKCKDPKPGDLREKFNEYDIAARAKKLSKLSLLKKQGVLVWYIGCRKHLESLYPYFFNHNNQKKVRRNSTWKDLILTLPGDTFGAVKDRVDEYIHPVFAYINLKNEEAKLLEK